MIALLVSCRKAPEQENIQFMQATAALGRQTVGFLRLPATPSLLIKSNPIAAYDGALVRADTEKLGPRAAACLEGWLTAVSSLSGIGVLVRARSREALPSKAGLEQLWGQDGGEAVPGDANGQLQPSVILQ